MSQNEFNAAFVNLSLDPPAPPRDPRQMVWEAVQRGQRKTHVLAALSITFWLIGAAGMLLMLLGLNRLILFIRIAPLVHADPRPHESDEDLLLWGTSLIHHSIPYIAVSVGAAVLAAIFTIMLIFSSRRVTFNRINISLMQISEQLKQMGRGGAGPESVQAAPSPDRQADYTLDKRGGGRKLAFITFIVLLIAAAAWITYGYVSNPWQGYARLSPFQAIRWQAETPQVEVDGIWYQFVSINDVPAEQIIGFSKSIGPDYWQKHFNEDLVELLTLMGHAPGGTATLQVQDLNSTKIELLKNVPMTEANRLAILKADQSGN
jgi:hypothetical protein